MSWRTVVIRKRAKLDLQLGYLVVRGDEVTKIHLSEIGILIIESTAVSLTAALLCELTKRKVKVIFCDEKYNPSSELVSYYGSHDTSNKIRSQIGWSENTKGLVWTEIVTEKIRKQQAVLNYFDLSDAENMLSNYIAEMEYRDTTNREGHAAKVYFNALFGMDFTRTADIPINAALNYGYGILLSCFNREVVANGYITQIGLFHDNTFNQFNLSSDLMEPFRPLVDMLVKKINPMELNHETKMMIIDLLNATVMIDGSRQYISNAIKIYCKSVFSALTENNIEEIKFYRNELQIYESYSFF